MAELFTFSEDGMRKLVDAYRSQQREMSNLKRHLAHYSTRRHEAVYMPSDVIRFELGGTLALRVPESAEPEHAEATPLRWDRDSNLWVTTGDRIEVFDWFGDEGMWNGIAGYQGWAKKRPETYGAYPAYEIIWMERKAQIIKFTSTEYMGQTVGGRMAATVSWYDHQGKNPGSSVNVYDPQGLFADAYSGAKGIAYYNNKDEQYEIEECARVGFQATATLSASCCAATASITGFAIQPVGEFIGNPGTTPTTATNPYKHSGPNGAKVKLIRTANATQPAFAWEVIDIERQVLNVVMDDGVTWTGTELKQDRREVSLETCEAEQAAELIVGSDECA